MAIFAGLGGDDVVHVSFMKSKVASQFSETLPNRGTRCADGGLQGADARRTNSATGVETFARRHGRTLLCHIRSTLRSEGVGRKPYRWWESSACLCRWRAAHPQQLLCRRRIYRRGTLPCLKSLSMRKKSPTSAWGRSTSSIRKPPEPPGSANNLPEVAEAAEAAEAAAEAVAEAAEAVEAAEAAAAEAAAVVGRGEFAAPARLKHFRDYR
jgi:hypothetical protein